MAMIDGIKSRLKSIEKDPWDPDLEFEPQADDLSDAPTEVLVATRASFGYSPGEWDLADYYKGIINTALQNGGSYGGHRISLAWLRIIRAGLEGKHIEPGTMWYAIQQDSEPPFAPDIPSYGELFPERDAPATP